MARKRMTLTELKGLATVDVPTAGSVLGISRESAYEAARQGKIPTLAFGRRLVVPVPKLLALMGAVEEEKR